NGRFLYTAANRFTSADTEDFFERLGVPLKTERGNRVFPQSDRASDIVAALSGYVKKNGVRIIHENVVSIEKDGSRFAVITDRGRSAFDRVIVATGGVSYPATGSTGDGYLFAKSFGHRIEEPVPSLVPLTVKGGFSGTLQGLALKNVGLRVRDEDTGKTVYEDFGEALFTHFGFSGPIVLSASAHMREKHRYTLVFDLKPALDVLTLDRRLLRDFAENPSRSFAVYLRGLMPASLAGHFADYCGIAKDRTLNSITRAERYDIIKSLKEYRFPVEGFRPIAEAIVTSGGVSTLEIYPKTMESRLCPGLYFAGEVIDCDAYTGGFNLQIAFSTAILAADAASGKI
ncbi:MAG: NAD(P)/FAD-dependent oxidoreductase, partial [Clostridia bacterium]|nr:NAD(P)/FAD-dependent oxidoreductase [Clostridia bacterium]